MKTYLLALLISWGLPFGLWCQTIENAGFDSLFIGGVDRIYHWVTSDFYPFEEGVAMPRLPRQYYVSLTGSEHMALYTVGINYDDPDSPRYLRSVKLYTRPELSYPDGTPFIGFLVNGMGAYTGDDGFLDFKMGGAAFPYRPSHLTGYYKYEAEGGEEFGGAQILLKKYNTATQQIDTIGYIESQNELQPVADWTSFELPISYRSDVVPDSIVIVFFSATRGSFPTVLWLDDLAFRYATTALDPVGVEADPVLYPNPTSGRITIKKLRDRPLSYQLFDLNGTLVQMGSFSNSIDVAELGKGVYLLVLWEGAQLVRQYRVVKQ